MTPFLLGLGYTRQKYGLHRLPRKIVSRCKIRELRNCKDLTRKSLVYAILLFLTKNERQAAWKMDWGEREIAKLNPVPFNKHDLNTVLNHFAVDAELYGIRNRVQVYRLRAVCTDLDRVTVPLLFADGIYYLVKKFDNFLSASPRYLCDICEGRFFGRECNLQAHRKVCLLKTTNFDTPISGLPTKLKFSYSRYAAPKSMGDKIRGCGIKVNRKDFLLRDYAVFDVETKAEKPDHDEAPIRISGKFEAEHILTPLLIVVHIRIKKRTKTVYFKCRQNDEPTAVAKLVRFLLKCSARAKMAAQKRLKRYFSLLNERLDFANRTKHEIHERKIIGCLKALNTFCDRFVVIGYNSKSFDIQLLRNAGLFYFLKKYDGELSILLKGSDYLLVETPSLRFIDMLSYLGGKMSLQNFLKVFLLPNPKKENQKLIFPYSILANTKRLTEPAEDLTVADFYNNLTQTNLLFTEMHSIYELEEKGLSRVNALSVLRLDETPMYGERLLEQLKASWQNEGIVSNWELLLRYARHDVIPLSRAIQQIVSDFAEREIYEPFQTFLSLPQLALPYFINGADSTTHFFLLNQETYADLRQNLMGGLAAVFKKYQRVGEVLSRKLDNVEREKRADTVQTIKTYDCNMLYSYGFSGEMFLGPWTKRIAENDFQRNVLNCDDAGLWLSYCQQLTGRPIKSVLNGGEAELYCGVLEGGGGGGEDAPLLVRLDGLQETADGIVGYEYHTCDLLSSNHSSCSAHRPLSVDALKALKHRSGETVFDVVMKHNRRIRLIRKNVYKLNEIWSCEFKDAIQNPKTKFERGLQDFNQRFAIYIVCILMRVF